MKIVFFLCFRILFGVFYLYFGGVFEGLAGIGKIEIIKDLAKVVVK